MLRLERVAALLGAVVLGLGLGACVEDEEQLPSLGVHDVAFSMSIVSDYDAFYTFGVDFEAVNPDVSSVRLVGMTGEVLGDVATPRDGETLILRAAGMDLARLVWPGGEVEMLRDDWFYPGAHLMLVAEEGGERSDYGVRVTLAFDMR